MTELISGFPSLSAPADTAAELVQNILATMSCHASPGRVGTRLPAEPPKLPRAGVLRARSRPTLLLEPSGGRCSGARGDLGGLKHRSLSRCRLCQMDTLEATISRSLRGQEVGHGQVEHVWSRRRGRSATRVGTGEVSRRSSS